MRATLFSRLFAVLLLCLVIVPLMAFVDWVFLRGQPVTEWGDLIPGVVTGFGVLGVAAWLAAIAGLVMLTVASERRRRRLATTTPDMLVAALDSPSAVVRRMALQTLADKAGQPFGIVACWPFQRHTPAQFEALVMLYREWLAVRAHIGRGSMVSRHVLRRLRAPVRVVMAEKCFGGGPVPREAPESYPLRPLPKDEFLSALTVRVGATLGRMAEALDQGTPGRLAAESEERVRAMLAELFWDALELGIRMRMDRNRQVRSTPPGRVEEIIGRAAVAVKDVGGRVEQIVGRAAVAVKDAILDWDPDGEERPAPPRAPLPPLEPERFVAALRGPVEEFIRSAAEAVNGVPDLDGMEATEDDVRALAEHLVRRVFAEAGVQRLDAAVARLPTAGETGAWATKYRRLLAAEGRVPDAAE
jgi:hypothetical protein